MRHLNPHRKWHVQPPGVEFTDANDHNPLVTEECPNCLGMGEGEQLVSIDTPNGPRQSIEWVTCSTCNGSGRGPRLVRFFDNDSPAIAIDVGPDGWLTCPGCDWRFTIRDPHAWTGRRHRRCGQRIAPAQMQERAGKTPPS
jgi:uncharacterized Zn-finger protein